MGDLASEMWRQAADSWYQRDRTAAVALAERDEGLDELHGSLTAGGMAVPVGDYRVLYYVDGDVITFGRVDRVT